MKLGVLTALFGDQPLEKALEFIKNAGLDAIELGAGNFAPTTHRSYWQYFFLFSD